MELKLKPSKHNEFPICGMLIRGTAVSDWLWEIQRMQFDLDAITVYPIPSTAPNSIWGCFVMYDQLDKDIEIGKHELCQLVGNILFLPERSCLSPKVTTAELRQLFWEKLHLIHPAFGLVELSEPIDWKTLLTAPKTRELRITKPQAPVFIPQQIKSFQINPISPEEVLENLETHEFPKQKSLANEPLNFKEQTRLAFYRQLFSKNKTNDQVEKTSLMSMLESARGLFDNRPTEWTEEMQKDFEALERRNQHQIDRLMEMLKNDPEEALKYAIPLDDTGTSRGGSGGSIGGNSGLGLFKRWSDFSLFGSGNSTFSGEGSASISDDNYYQLQQQYHRTAEALIRDGDFRKAAFIYMKLLKNYYLAAQTLEKGGIYQEAAAIYLKYIRNKTKAAECFEKGNLIQDAIEIYQELNQLEKVGDLYGQINQREQANHYYKQVIESHRKAHQYVKAALLSKNKLLQVEQAQALLLEGWRTNRDAYNCLNNYFNNIEDENVFKKSLLAIYQDEVTPRNQLSFLRVIKHEFAKREAHTELIRDMAYEVLVAQIPYNTDLVSELAFFNKTDQLLPKDSMRFRLKQRKR
ncbi:MAG: hypothetical protein ACPGJS_11610 [Flammeovirgaceae bacterium]